MMKKALVLAIVLLMVVAGVGAQDSTPSAPRLLPERDSCNVVEFQLAVEELQKVISPMADDIQTLVDPDTTGIIRELTVLSMSTNTLYWYDVIRPSVLYCPELVEIVLQVDHSLSLFALALNLDNANLRLGYIESATGSYSDLFLLINELTESRD